MLGRHAGTPHWDSSLLTTEYILRVLGMKYSVSGIGRYLYRSIYEMSPLQTYSIVFYQAGEISAISSVSNNRGETGRV